MKMRVAFVIPISEDVVKLVQSLPRAEGKSYLFTGQGKTGLMHANAIRTLLHVMKYEHITRHTFRSSFREWAGECTHYPREVCEMALAHDERDQTEGAYSRSDFLDKRSALMNDWSKFTTSSTTAPQHLTCATGINQAERYSTFCQTNKNTILKQPPDNHHQEIENDRS